jgi:hypothetical protein
LGRLAAATLALALGALALALAGHRAAADSPRVRPIAGRIQIAGRPRTVFDWSRQACVPAEGPDLPVRAFRDSRGRVQMLLPHYANFRLIGPTLQRLRPDCQPVMVSAADGRPAAYNDRDWIASVFTRDGRTIWALVHDEFQGNRHPGRCPSGSYYRCWYNAVTLARSDDGGRSYRPAPAPRNLVAGPAFRYRPGVGPSGVFTPSNFVRGPDRAQYVLVRIRDLDGRRGTCLLRTATVGEPGSWRAWDGDGFDGRFEDPYLAAAGPRAHCTPVGRGRIAEMTESLTYNTVLRRYLLVGVAPPGPLSLGRKLTGIYYSTSADLIHWTPRRLLLPVLTRHSYRCGGPTPIAYPSLIDPSSPSRTFAATGAHPFLYFTRFGYRHCRQTENRDLLRVRLRISP